MKIAVGGGDKGKIKNVDIQWGDLATKLTSHVVGAKGKKFFVGGYFQREVREDSELIARTFLTFDIDNAGMSLGGIEYLLMMNLDCAYVAYSTHSHTVLAPRIRIIIPLSREITGSEYRVLSRSVGASLGIPLDACSYKPNQLMYTPTTVEGADIWTLVGEGDFYPVPRLIVTPDEGDLDDLDTLIASTPLDLTDEQVDAYLAAYPAVGLDYDGWFRVGMALKHQYPHSESEIGFKKWVDWSSQDAGRFKADVMMPKWVSFARTSNPVTMASIIHNVKAAGGIVAVPNAFETLLEDASAVETFEQFNEFKSRIVAMPTNILPPVQRSGVISELSEGFGKLNKISKTAITKDLQPAKRGQVVGVGSPPEWLRDWVYVENTCSFANFEVSDYDIKREAFNAKFDRETECILAEKPASQLALVDYRLPTVVDTMFFPLAGKFFEYEHKRMMNSFSSKGVQPVATIDSAGQAAIDLFLAHVRFTLASESEQTLFVDWMAYIYQNQGKRVGWAMLLQGAQGSGKSYFGNVFEMLMGTNVKSLDTQAISGRFTGWATGSLVTVVEEIRIVGTNKYEILDKLKPIISNATIQIEEKGRDHRTVPNFTSYFLLTNHKDAVPLQDGDRRYCALFSRVQTEEELFAELGGQAGARSYFDTLFNSARANSGAIAKLLLDRVIPSSFDAQGRAPETSARLEMKALSVSPERDIVDDAIGMYECSVINSEMIDVTWLNILVSGMGGELPKSRALTSILSEKGYAPIEGRRVNVSGNHHYIWLRGLKLTEPISSIKKIIRDFHSREKDELYENVPF